MKKNYLVAIIAIVLVGAGAFFGGIKYQQSKQSFPSRSMGLGLRNSGNRSSFRPINGEIINVDDKSITVKLQDGSSRIVLLSDNTKISKAQNASKSDLSMGEKVMVFGAENSDGSITAANIQLNSVVGAGNGN